MHEEEEKLVRMTVYLEEDMIDALREAALELEKDTKMKWSRGAVLRLAVSDFFARRGKIV